MKMYHIHFSIEKFTNYKILAFGETPQDALNEAMEDINETFDTPYITPTAIIRVGGDQNDRTS